MITSLIFAATLMASTLGGGPQDPDESVVLPGVEVVGVRRTREATERYVEMVAEPPFGARTLATWDRPLCIEVDNLSDRVTQALLQRIEDRAGLIGVSMASKPCVANVRIFATSDGSATAQALVGANRRAFRPAAAYTNLDGRALERFRENPDPVRWWTVSVPVNATNGQPLVIPRTETAALGGINLDGRSLYWENRIKNTIGSVVVVIDASKTAGVSVASLGDYIAFTVLAQVDASADYGNIPTIMNIFEDPNIKEMTDFDQDYLTALYDVSPVSPSLARHRRSVIERMRRGED